MRPAARGPDAGGMVRPAAASHDVQLLLERAVEDVLGTFRALTAQQLLDRLEVFHPELAGVAADHLAAALDALGAAGAVEREDGGAVSRFRGTRARSAATLAA